MNQHRQRVTGKLVASLIPSSTKVEEFDVTLKPGEKKGGDPFLVAEYGLSGVVMKEDAEGERVPDPENPTKTVINRIRSLSLKDVRVVDLDAQEEAENRAQEAKAEERQRNEELARRRAAELERQNQIKRQRQEQEAKERARREEQQQVQADQQQRYNNSMRQMQDDLTRTLTRGTRAGADKECLGCNGKGNVSCAFCFGQGTVVGFPKPTECGVCKGSGRAPCILCGGSGQKKF